MSGAFLAKLAVLQGVMERYPANSRVKNRWKDYSVECSTITNRLTYRLTPSRLTSGCVIARLDVAGRIQPSRGSPLVKGFPTSVQPSGHQPVNRVNQGEEEGGCFFSLKSYNIAAITHAGPHHHNHH